MRLRWLGVVLLFAALAAGLGQKTNQPDAVNVSGNSLQSTYFKFHYSFPQDWSPQKDELRLEKNTKRHEDAVKRLQTDASRTANSRGTTGTTKVFWVYDLLFVSPALAAQEKLLLPYIRIWAMECSNVTNKPGDYAKLVQGVNSYTQLGETEAVTLAGRKFMRSNFVFEGEHSLQKQFETLFETLSGKYLLIFEFHGKTEQEIKELAKTMESVSFGK
jgi:hypothetical protein